MINIILSLVTMYELVQLKHSVIFHICRMIPWHLVLTMFLLITGRMYRTLAGGMHIRHGVLCLTLW